MKNNKLSSKHKRRTRVRKKLSQNQQLPRLSVFRSNKYLFAQIIDDRLGKTLASVCENETVTVEKNKSVMNQTQKKQLPEKPTKSQRAIQVGEIIARKAKLLKISSVRFDRGAYKYHGRIKFLAEAARKNGLNF